jgi:hypothetical protein
MRFKLRVPLGYLVLSASIVTGVLVISAPRAPNAGPASAGAVGAIPPINVNLSKPPSDLHGTVTGIPGAAGASIEDAGAFAWQEFIALNWPAVKQSGGLNQRDTPDSANCAFAEPKCDDRLRVWETYRGKVEIFPGDGNPPPGYSTPPPNAPTWSWGYDALPQYDYQSGNVSGPCDSPSPQPSGVPTAAPAWINLDETDQITLDSMYSGMAPPKSTGNADPQLVRFLAKANRTEYQYVARNGWWTGPGTKVPFPQTIAYVNKYKRDPPPDNNQLVSLPNGTIEVKAGWRLLGPLEDPRQFHVQRVRFYENPAEACYREQTWALVALHIIQKTPSAPYFIYATFEQADNLRTKAGFPVENADGAIVAAPTAAPNGVCPSGQSYPCPTTPRTQFLDGPTPMPSSIFPPQIVLNPANAPYCTADLKHRPPNQLYYLNEGNVHAVPSKGFICVNHRDQLIPPEIIAVNRAAHAAIAAYTAKHGFTPGPWAHYKLVNVQYVPVDKTYGGYFRGNNPNNYNNPASYYLSNSVVETNTVLQTFSGGLIPPRRSDYQYQFWLLPNPTPTPTAPPFTATHKQVFYAGHGYDMGGCMGCHGSQGQDKGGNFSVILANGPVDAPEVPLSAAAGLNAGNALTAARRAPPHRNRHLKADVIPPISAH